MSIEAHTAADARTVITWREAVERAHSVARVFEDGRPVFGVDSLGHVVLANRAAAAFSGGAVAFGKAVPPGGTVAALVARFASRAVTGETTFERTRAVMGLRATMLGLKLGKVEVAPFGPLTLVTFAEGVAPIPDEGGVMGDPLDAGLAIDPPTGADAVDIADDAAAAMPAVGAVADVTAASAIAPVASPIAAPAVVAPIVVAMEDPFSDASFAAFSPISIDADEWGVPAPSAPAVAADPTDAALADLDETNAVEPEIPMPVVADAPWLDEMSADDAEPVDALSPPEALGALDMAARDEAIAAAPVAADAIAAGLVDRATPADHGLDGVAALAALDGVAEPEVLAEALEAETVDSAETMAEIAALEASDAPVEATRDGEAVADERAADGTVVDETVVDEPSDHDAVAMVDAPAAPGDEADVALANDAVTAWDDATAAVEDAMAPPAAFAALAPEIEIEIEIETEIDEAAAFVDEATDSLEAAAGDVDAAPETMAEDAASDQSVEIDTTVDQEQATPDRTDAVDPATDAVDAATDAVVEVTPADVQAEATATAPVYQGRLEPHRFVWQMDAGRRFTLVSRELSDAVGVHGTAMVGRTWADVAGALGLDPDGRVEAALARRDTWSGLTVMWPVAGAPVRVPVDLAALPSFGRNRTFDGYRGFGVCRTAEWQADPNAPITEPETLKAPAVDVADEVAEPAIAAAAPVLGLTSDHLVDAAPAVVPDAAEVLPNFELTADSVDEVQELLATPGGEVAPETLVPTVTDGADEATEAAEQTDEVATVADTVVAGEDETTIEPSLVSEPSPVTEPVAPSADTELAETTTDPVAAADAPMEVAAADKPVADAPAARSEDELSASELAEIEPMATEVEPAADAAMPAALAAMEPPAVDEPVGVAAVEPTAPVAAAAGDEVAEDTLAERLTASVHDAAHSALDDAEAPQPAGGSDPSVAAVVDPDAVAHAEGTALPPEVTAPVASLMGAAAAPVDVPMDGTGLGDAVAELSDHLETPAPSAPLADLAPSVPAADADRVGLPTWHDTPVSVVAETNQATTDHAAEQTGEAETAPVVEASSLFEAAPILEPAPTSEVTPTFEVTIDDALATAPTLDPADVVGETVVETTSHLMDAANELPTEAARILDDVETTTVAAGEAVAETAQALVAPVVDPAEAVADTVTAAVADTLDPAALAQVISSADEALAAGASVADRLESDVSEGTALAANMGAALEGSVVVDEGMAPDERFGLVAAVNEPAVPELPLVEARPDRASLSEIAAALNAEMRAREAEAARRAEPPVPEETNVSEKTNTAVGSLLPAAEPPVAFVPPSRPDNVIAAPIGPGAKVVTLPAGPRGHERVGERAPLSPPERDAFRQIAKVLGARMEEDGPAPAAAQPTEPVAVEPVSTDALHASDLIAHAATDPATDANAAQLADIAPVVADESDLAGAAALGRETADLLVGSLSDTTDLINGADETERFEHSPLVAETVDLEPAAADADVVVSVPETLAPAIDADEAAFVADADMEARGEPVVVDVDTVADTALETTDAALADAAWLDEGSDVVAPFVAADDLVGEAAHLDPVPLAAMPAARETVPSAASASQQPVLEEFPMAVAVVQGQEIPFANQAFLELLGYATLDDLNAAGGMDAMFAGPHALKGWSGDAAIRPLPAITRDGVVVPVCVRIAKTRWADAPALVMAMETAERAVAALEAPADAALEAERVSSLMSDPTDAELGGAFDDTDELDPRARVAELEAVLDTATDGVVILDAEGAVVSVNRAGQALLGADAASLSGRRLVDLLAPESRRAAQDYLDGLARNGVQSLLNDGREVIAVEAGGGLVPLFMTVGRLGEGRSRAFCAVMRDITQWKKAEEELTAAKKHAELASLHKSDFLAKISHEIRTPLNAIMGFAEVMIDERFGPIGTERYKEYLKDIRTSGAHIMSLVNDLLDLSKIEAGKLDLKFEAVDLNGILRECVALMQPQANRERIIIRASLPTQVPPIVADGRSIRQIMLNLLSNAVKFTPAGGQVIVSTALEDQGQVALRVRDTGVGMTEAEVLQALEPFRQVHTAKNGAAGTGLGLPLTKALVEANRAAFAIRSTPGQGTLVEIVFPSTRVLAS